MKNSQVSGGCKPSGRRSLTILTFSAFCLWASVGVAAPSDAILPAPLPGEQGKAAADSQPNGTDAILDMDVEQLAHVEVVSPSLETEVTSVSRTAQPVGRSAAAVYVVTNEMIKRSGAANVPEVLRTVPGVNVSRINASAWAISVRGFNGRQAGMLLVQIDGVPIYNPLHSGVFWERNYVMLEDVDRIEVIRGSGASVWGANAVNGIINIVTKSSKDTQGVFASAAGGNEHRQFSNFRVGAQTGQNLTWRMYGQNVDDAPGVVPAPNRAVDSNFVGKGGFRADWTPTRQDTVTVQGDFHEGICNQNGYILPPAPTDPRTNINTTFLTRWTRTLDEDTDWSLQLVYFNPYSTTPTRTINTSMFDSDFQFHTRRDRHDIVWGVGYRNNDEMLSNMIADTEQIPSFFVQDTITLVEDRLFSTFGSKFDFNSVTDYEYQPTAKLAWTPNERTSIWSSISRAVRTPSLLDRSAMTGGYKSEDMVGYEAGFRRQATERFFWEVAVFSNHYDNLIGRQGFARVNVGTGQTHGFEFNAAYEVTKTWRLTGWYAFLIEDIDWPTGYSAAGFNEGGAPRNEFYLQSGWDLGRNVSLDVMFRYMDTLAAGVEEYFAGDIRLAWRPTRNLELSLVGQNLFAGRYYEFVMSGEPKPTMTQPGVYGMVAYRY